jgi:hypothetical protein
VKHRAVEPVNIFKKTLCIYVVIKFAVWKVFLKSLIMDKTGRNM